MYSSYTNAELRLLLSSNPENQEAIKEGIKRFVGHVLEESDIEQAYNNGYEEGHAEGYDEGSAEGYKEGYEDSREEQS